MAVVRNGDKQQKLNVDKLTSDFKELVNLYSKLQNVIPITRITLTWLILTRPHPQDVASKMKVHMLQNASQLDDQNSDALNQSNITEQQYQQQQQQLISRNLEFENSMALERAQRVENIERDVLDINQIMVDLSTMIDEQADDISKYTNWLVVGGYKTYEYTQNRKDYRISNEK